jgi:hypothetical protein
MINTAVSQHSPKRAVDLRTQEIPSDIIDCSFYVYTGEQLQKLVDELPDGTTPKHKGKIIPFARIQIETGNAPVTLNIKQCIYPQCKRLFLSAGSSHRKCHHIHKHPIEKLY